MLKKKRRVFVRRSADSATGSSLSVHNSKRDQEAPSLQEPGSTAHTDSQTRKDMKSQVSRKAAETSASESQASMRSRGLPREEVGEAWPPWKQDALNEVPEGSGSEGKAQEATFGALPFRNSLNVNREDRIGLALQYGRSPPKATEERLRATSSEVKSTTAPRPELSPPTHVGKDGQFFAESKFSHLHVEPGPVRS